MLDLRALGRWLSSPLDLAKRAGPPPGEPTAGQRVLTWIYRPQCAACGAAVSAGLPFCRACSLSLDENCVACRRCAEPLSGPRDAICRRCHRRPLPLSQIVAPWLYGGSLAEALVRLKFAGRTEVARALAPLISTVLYTTAKVREATLLVPVPLHWTRRLRRGFDQSQLLLDHACALSPPAARVARVLRRARATEYQSRAADARARARNVLGAFRVHPRWLAEVKGARVVLFDDVVTTGATMAAAARALRRAGAADVVGVALARGGSRL